MCTLFVEINGKINLSLSVRENYYVVMYSYKRK